MWGMGFRGKLGKAFCSFFHFGKVGKLLVCEKERTILSLYLTGFMQKAFAFLLFFLCSCKERTKETTPLRGAPRGFEQARLLRSRELAARLLGIAFMKNHRQAKGYR